MRPSSIPHPGNCWCGALVLRLLCGGRIRRLRVRGRACRPRHWICVLPSGEAWHFKRVARILPPPLDDLVFLGRYERLPPRRHERGEGDGGERRDRV